MRTGPGSGLAPASVVADLRITSEPGNVRHVRERMRAVGADLGLPPARVDGLEAAVAEAVLNAIEHGNGGEATRLVEVRARVAERALVVRVSHEGCGGGPPAEPTAPDLDAKLRGEQTERGWGLFLIRHLVDRLEVRTRGGRDGVELVLRLDDVGS